MHALLFELLVEHEYYADRRCPDFAPLPSADTERLLRGHRCVARPCVNGIRVYAPVAPGDKWFLPIPESTALVFNLELRNPELPLFTDGVAWTPAGDVDPGRLRPAQPGPGGYPGVEIHLNPVAQSRSYRVAFKSRRMYWAYYLVSDGKPQAAPVLSDGEKKLSFDATENPPGDPMLASLPQPAAFVWRFVSSDTIPCSETPRKQLHLTFGERELSPLPNPSIRRAAGKDRLVQIVQIRA